MRQSQLPSMEGQRSWRGVRYLLRKRVLLGAKPVPWPEWVSDCLSVRHGK